MTSAYLSPVVAQIGDILSIIRAKLFYPISFPEQTLSFSASTSQNSKCSQGGNAVWCPGYEVVFYPYLTVEKFSNATFFRQMASQNPLHENLGFSETVKSVPY